MIHSSAILALLNKGGDDFEVIVKPEYLSTIQAQVFGLRARIKNIKAVIKQEKLELLSSQALVWHRCRHPAISWEMEAAKPHDRIY